MKVGDVHNVQVLNLVTNISGRNLDYLFCIAQLLPGLEVIKLEYSFKLKIKRNDWLLADMPASSQSLRFIFEVENELKFYNLGDRPLGLVVSLLDYGTR